MKKLLLVLALCVAITATGQVSVDTVNFYESYLFTNKIDSAKMVLIDFTKSTNRSYTFIGIAAPSVVDIKTTVCYTSSTKDTVVNKYNANPKSFNHRALDFFLQKQNGFNPSKKIQYPKVYPALSLFADFEPFKGKKYCIKRIAGSKADVYEIWRKYFYLGGDDKKDKVYFTSTKGKNIQIQFGTSSNDEGYIEFYYH